MISSSLKSKIHLPKSVQLYLSRESIDSPQIFHRDLSKSFGDTRSKLKMSAQEYHIPMPKHLKPPLIPK